MFLDLHYKLFLITHYRTVLRVQIAKTTQLYSTINNQQNNINHLSTSHPYNISHNMTQNTRSQTSNPAYTNTRANPYINTTYTQPFRNSQNIHSKPSITPIYNLVYPIYNTSIYSFKSKIH